MNKAQEHTTPNGYIWYRLENNVYGSPRVMTHFLNLVSPYQLRKAYNMSANNASESIKTLERWAKLEVHGRSYRARWFGGGIVWTSCLSDKQIDDLIDCIQAQ